jgi:hypothetical protein
MKTLVVGPIGLGVVILGCLVFTLVTSGFSGTLLFMGLPLVGLAVPLAAARGKARAFGELSVDVSFCPQTRTVRFSSHPARVVELPSRDVLAVRYRERALEPVQGVRVSLPRASFALVAETPQGDVELAVPLVCAGNSFIEAARLHLGAVLADVTRKIAEAGTES